MKILLSFFLFTSVAFAQKINFEYDTSGNQTSRTLCLTCGARLANTTEIEENKVEEVQNFIENDNILYYPNPVLEELFIKWELVNEKAVSSIYLFALNGQILKTFDNLEKMNTTSIPFYGYPEGTYLIVLNYNNGEQKTIKIVK